LPTIQISNQSVLPLEKQRLRMAVCMVLKEAGTTEAKISVAVVDDPTIARLNRQFLDHEGPTDVLSFALEEDQGRLEGEIVVSADTATRTAAEYGWSPQEELLFYVVHGALHLVGYDDATPAQRAQMRRRERAVLKQLGILTPKT
jgi:probable rRNA maturation factor